jgi:raffinose/stachyose/melibiose transport system permease protein
LTRFAGRAIGHALLIFWTVLAVIPFLLIALLSLRNNADMFASPLSLRGPYEFNNYAVAWRGPSSGSPGMATFFVNTGIAAIVALVANLGAGSLGAYFATRLSRRAQSRCVRAVMVGTVVPFILLIVPYYRIYDGLGLLDNPSAIGLAYGALALPATFLVLYAHFVDFPPSLLDAGKVDGLGEMGSYWRLVLPLSKGALTTVGALLIIFVWNEAQLGIVLLQSPADQTVSVGLLEFQGIFTTELGYMFAGLTLASVPVIVFYLIFHRTVTRGIALGGVFR